MKKRTLYKLLAASNDANAVAKKRVTRRVGRRIFGKGTGKLARKWFG